MSFPHETICKGSNILLPFRLPQSLLLSQNSEKNVIGIAKVGHTTCFGKTRSSTWPYTKFDASLTSGSTLKPVRVGNEHRNRKATVSPKLEPTVNGKRGFPGGLRQPTPRTAQHRFNKSPMRP